MLHPALLLGEGEGEARAEDDVGNKEDADTEPEEGAVAVEDGAEDEAVAIGGLGVTGTVPLLLVDSAIENVPVEVGVELAAALEPDADADPP